MLDSLSEDQIREIHKDEAISDLLENWLDLVLFADSPMSMIVEPDRWYTDNDRERHILKFLKNFHPDQSNHLQLRKQRGISSTR